ncbi:MAG: 3-hydroxyacyl-CoA dehydrogenase [Absicoccus porci]|uniref:3-hydroxyacyl-CoA dehydrogenase n=1 Tax=Absicoccus porci TaxID=2486576 RepID=UPI0015682CED|nr:3-hydroxyacyl-CoA dehydrogenase [Absicoccus porci]MEE1355328.1 3-hydroxyacyl-CoA dehydrogenase [Absicoccus porci]
MNNRKVVVVGGGVLGSQIAFQAAYQGFDVTFWLRMESSKTRTQPKLDRLKSIYLSSLEALKPYCGTDYPYYPHGLVADLAHTTVADIEAKQAQVEKAYDSIVLELDMEKACKDAMIVIEAMSEDLEAKKDIYQKLSQYLEPDTILASNSSTMVPSQFVDYVSKPERYLNMHFANEIWKYNIVEIMAHPNTDPQIYEQAVAFGKQLGMEPICLKKEQPGYVLNSLLVPFLNAGLNLYVNGIADAPTIDKTWRKATGAPYGPMQILDIVGLQTAYNIARMDPSMKKAADMLKDYIDQGKTGVAAKEGFYSYK